MKQDCFSLAPPIIKEFLGYMGTVKGKSPLTVEEYFMDLRTFFRYMKQHRNQVPQDMPFDEISIDDIDLEGRECVVYGKGDKERKVYFDAKAKVHLKEYIERRTDQNEALFVTLDAPHDRLKISGVEIRLRKLGRRLDLERIHPHKFRRTMATRAIDKGMPIEQVQKILGHSQIDTTMQYAMVNQSNVKTSHQKYMG